MQRHYFRFQPHALLVKNHLQTCQKISYLKVTVNVCLRPEHLINYNTAVRKLFFNRQLHYLSQIPNSYLWIIKYNILKKKNLGGNKDKSRGQAPNQKFGKQGLFYRLGLMFSECEEFSNLKCKVITSFPPNFTQNEVDLALIYLFFFKSRKKTLESY